MDRKWIAAAVIAGAAALFWRAPSHTSAIAVATPAPTPARAASGCMRRCERSPGAVVYVAGAVKRPGLYHLPGGARAGDAVRAAGGFSASADAAATNLAQRVDDGMEVRVYAAGEAPRTRSSMHTTRPRARKTSAPHAAVDINSADEQMLASLPGVGALLAQRIVTYRELNGPFASLDELLDVAGVTPRRLDALEPYLELHGAEAGK